MRRSQEIRRNHMSEKGESIFGTSREYDLMSGSLTATILLKQITRALRDWPESAI
jgi:hypothetical protein